MSDKEVKVKLPTINKPIMKKASSFVSGKPSVKSKIVTNKDAYKRV